MNIKNNKRNQNTIKTIQEVFLELITHKEIKDITVSDICEIAKINRSTFYANYDNISALAKTICLKIQDDLRKISVQKAELDFTWLFKYVMENRNLFTAYFKLCKIADITAEKHLEKLDEKSEYHFEFFISGVHSIVELWLTNGCVEPVEEMNKILLEKYNKIF